MDDATKKKALLGVLAVAALGAVAYMGGFIGGDSGPKKTAGASGPVERRKTEAKTETKTTRREAPKAAPEEKEEVVRRERDEETEKSVERRKKRTEKKEEKKKVIAPAA